MLIRPLSPELQNKAESELNETPNRIKEDLQHIRQWLVKQPHLKPRTDEQWLISFLRGCKFSLQRTKEKLDYFYTTRTLVPEFFENRDPLLPEIQEILNCGVFLPLPKTADPSSPKLMLYRWGICNPEKIHFINLIKMYLMCMDILMKEDDNCAVAGVCVFVDLKGFSSSYLLQSTPALLKKAVLCVENAYPVRTKKVDCACAPSAFELLFNIMKPFLSEKLKNRVGIYSEKEYEKVYKSFPQSLLPKEYGGENGSVVELTAEWKKKFESCREWFLEDSKFRTYEELRVGKPKTSADMFGVEGTFRKLAVD